MKYIGIDIGGTWIKGTVEGGFSLIDDRVKIKKVKSPLKRFSKVQELVTVLESLIDSLVSDPREIGGIGISTSGIVNYHGTKVINAAPHIYALRESNWSRGLQEKYNCSVTLINDADAAVIGFAEMGMLKGDKAIGIMPVGTGLGLSVWRNGRRWRPGKQLTLLGSIDSPTGNYDLIASAARLAKKAEDNDLTKVLSSSDFEKVRKGYLIDLVRVIRSAAIIYSLDEVIIGGGLADAANACNYPLADQLNTILDNAIRIENVKVVVAKKANNMQLKGALELAKGQTIALQQKVIPEYKKLDTEIPYKEGIHLEKMRSNEILDVLWEAEQLAGERLKNSLGSLSMVIEESVKRMQRGGRIIYVGAGASGRIAAMDAVEIPCTYGFPSERVIAIVAGGVSDATIEIESDFEEDASSIPEMLLLNIQREDVVIGISASGSAFYVQSALSLAKQRGALSVSMQVTDAGNLPFCDYIIPLNSGNEVVAGSTRMKAGTATKKMLNFFSSGVMIRLGKVVDAYMIDMACINSKLEKRAVHILNKVYGLNEAEAIIKLKQSNMDLPSVIKNIK